MKDFIRIFFSLSAFLCMWSCSDGDIITFELEFDQQLERCGNVGIENFDSSEASYVLYDLKTDPGESLILLMPGSSTYDAILFPTESPYETSFGINLRNSGRVDAITSNLFGIQLLDCRYLKRMYDQYIISGKVLISPANRNDIH